MPDDFLMREYEEAKARASARLTLLQSEQLCRLGDGLGGRIDVTDDHWSLLVALAKDLVRAGFPIHDCSADAPEGGVCLTPRRAGGSGPANKELGGGGAIQVIVTWNQHDASAYPPSNIGTTSDIQEYMNYALADVATALGYVAEPLEDATAHVWVVTGRRPETVEAG